MHSRVTESLSLRHAMVFEVLFDYGDPFHINKIPVNVKLEKMSTHAHRPNLKDSQKKKTL